MSSDDENNPVLDYARPRVFLDHSFQFRSRDQLIGCLAGFAVVAVLLYTTWNTRSEYWWLFFLVCAAFAGLLGYAFWLWLARAQVRADISGHAERCVGERHVTRHGAKVGRSVHVAAH